MYKWAIFINYFILPIKLFKYSLIKYILKCPYLNNENKTI